MTEMYINGEDAFSTYGVRMSKDFIQTLDAPKKFKDDIENESPLESGKRIIPSREFASADVTLTFNVYGNSASDMVEKKDAFLAFLYTRRVTIYIPSYSDYHFRLLYTGDNASYKRGNYVCSIVAKFKEPNPTDRGDNPKDGSLFAI